MPISQAIAARPAREVGCCNHQQARQVDADEEIERSSELNASLDSAAPRPLRGQADRGRSGWEGPVSVATHERCR